MTKSTTNRFIELFYQQFASHVRCPFQSLPQFFTVYFIIFSLSVLQQLCRIFKWFADTVFSLFSRFFQPHFLIINIRVFVARGKFFGPHRAKFFCTLRPCRFFWQRQTGRISSSLISCFLHNRPFDIFDNVGIGTQSISCQNIKALLCYMIFSAFLTDDCQHLIREH